MVLCLVSPNAVDWTCDKGHVDRALDDDAKRT
jgi:hypothetical protein